MFNSNSYKFSKKAVTIGAFLLTTASLNEAGTLSLPLQVIQSKSQNYNASSSLKRSTAAQADD
ncbi:hypothetical protein HANVADRAFT_4022, partial [Hanseniaspora valbyensis NRRL Y-1626]